MMLSLCAATDVAQIRPTVQNLPDGDYRYRDSVAIDRPFREIQFRKRDRYITGSDSDKRTGKSYCFRGMPQQNQIIDITLAIEISPKTAQQTEWKLAPGNPINFDRLYPLQAGPGLELYKCLTAFLPELKKS
ncbi:hypothetical protein IQ270_28515 [Microcoleus sp. LEGE 07076]|uniref:hypothetical protein n=1 Tax=Microcoleus sp. LEGE 07076 TaxID=915322 RepID=UPI00187F18B7|nr:hypothetical protein [Microcoleus sp. LEGE 07076]MBE9188472.1 hypothetical protein [Microcoleus sp. LEGE 07076]